MVLKTPAQQLAGFLGKFEPSVAKLARGSLARLRARLPGAFELVYDNYNALAIAFSPSNASSATIFSIAVYPRWSPAVESLIAAALKLAKEPFDPAVRGRLIIKAVAAKQRPRRAAH